MSGAGFAALGARPVTIVGGKGGVGKSTIAAALASALAQTGAQVALVAHRDAGVPPIAPDALPPGLDLVELDLKSSLKRYLHDQLPGPLASALGAQRAFGILVAATPGLQELLAAGELLRLSHVPDGGSGIAPYDHVVYDAPATGHLMALLQSPRRLERAAAIGPVAKNAGRIDRFLHDPERCGTVIVTTAERLAVSEALEFAGALRTELGYPPSAIVANRLGPVPLQPSERHAEEAAAHGDGLNARAARAVLAADARSRAQRAQLARLTRELGTQPVQVEELATSPTAALASAIELELA
jgi:anion-transporting  ArsA/GET3 family ATPase